MNISKIFVFLTAFAAVVTAGYAFFATGANPEEFRQAVLAVLALLGIGTAVAATTGGNDKPALGPPK